MGEEVDAELEQLVREHAAMQRVATLVATQPPQEEVFAAVTRETAMLLGARMSALLRVESSAEAVIVAGWSRDETPVPVGSRGALDGRGLVGQILRTGRPVRLEDYDEVGETVAAQMRQIGVRSAVAGPIVLGGRIWGALSAAWPEGVPIPAGAEERVAGFAELVSYAIDNAETREDLRRLADEQAALRRVATLVAEGAPPAEVFGAVAAEVAALLDLPLVEMCRYEPDGTATVIGAVGDHPFQTGTNWTLDGPSLTAEVKHTGRPARVEDYADVPGSMRAAARAAGVHAGVGAPIVVDGKVWGVVSAGGSARVTLLPDAETRLSKFTELIATAVSNVQARQDLRRLADEQAALRRIATLVAEGADARAVFDAVCEETGRLFAATSVNLAHFTPEGVNETMAGWSLRGVHVPTGTLLSLEGESINSVVRGTAAPGRFDSYETSSGELAARLRGLGIRSEVGAPVIVEGQVWGALIAGTDEPEPLPSGTEFRLAKFAELIGTAIANAQAREELRQLAEEQAALRRVATLVAEGAAPKETFGLVAQEIARITGLELVVIGRFEPDRTMTSVGAAGEHPYQPGTVWPLDGENVSSRVLDTGQPVTIDPYRELTGTIATAAHAAGISTGVGAPIIVEGRVWGTVSAGGTERAPLPPDIERRLMQFTELVATAVSNAQARQDLQGFVEEQASLRRIATLVAQGAESQVVFDAVCEETGRLFGAATVNLVHFTPDDFHLAVSGWSLRGVHVPTGTLLPLEGDSIDTLVRRTAAPGRCDSYEHARGEIAALLRQLGVRSEVGAPVVVDGKVWGALIAGTDEPEPLAAGTEHRLASFAELIATAVSNTAARSELIASRARIFAAGDEQRRRVVRDLHDGAQQRLVHAVMTLQLARSEPNAPPELARLVGDALEHTSAAIEELRELAHGIHPALLTTRGLAAAVGSLADRAPVPVKVEIPEERYPASVESAAYFVVAETLTNVAKYARASAARVAVTPSGNVLVIEVEDDGVGGATPSTGSGLAGLRDRLAALQGQLIVDSAPARGTRVRAEIPLAASPPSDAADSHV